MEMKKLRQFCEWQSCRHWKLSPLNLFSCSCCANASVRTINASVYIEWSSNDKFWMRKWCSNNKTTRKRTLIHRQRIHIIPLYSFFAISLIFSTFLAELYIGRYEAICSESDYFTTCEILIFVHISCGEWGVSDVSVSKCRKCVYCIYPRHWSVIVIPCPSRLVHN